MVGTKRKTRGYEYHKRIAKANSRVKRRNKAFPSEPHMGGHRCKKLLHEITELFSDNGIMRAIQQISAKGNKPYCFYKELPVKKYKKM